MFENMSLQGSWKPTPQEIILKCNIFSFIQNYDSYYYRVFNQFDLLALYNLLKAKNAPSELVKDGETYSNLLDNFKKEFKVI